MLGYHDYKALHLVGLIFFLISLSRYHDAEKTGKFFKSFIYAFGAITLSTGSILMVRWGLHESLPAWIWIKYLVTVMLFITIWYLPRESKIRPFLPFCLGILVLIAVYCSVYKPF